MNKKIIAFMLAVLVFFVLKESGVLSGLIIFILVGALPGTSYSISPSTMLLAIAILTCSCTVWCLAHIVKRYIPRFKLSKDIIKKHQENLPKRRFSKI